VEVIAPLTSEMSFSPEVQMHVLSAAVGV